MTFNDDLDLLKKIITGDESWVYGCDIETKAQSSRFATIEEIKEKSKQKSCWRYLKAHFKSVSSIGKNAGIRVLYLRGVALKATR